MFKPVARIALMAVIFFAASNQAFAEWVVARVTGTVTLVAPDATASAPTEGQLLPNGWGVSTAADGRAMLTRAGGEAISVSPNSQLVITEDGPATQVLQPRGVVEYDVEPRDVRHFAVETPILAAVVKGTKFVVTVGGGAGSVAVERGAVEVTAFASGQVGLFLAGQTATLARPDGDLDFSGDGTPPTINDGAPRSPLAMPSFASLTLSPAGAGVAAAANVGPVVGTVAVEVGPGEVAVEAVVGTGPVGVTVGAGVGVTPDAIGVDLDVGAVVGPIDLDLGVDVGVDVDDLEVELDLDLPLPLPVVEVEVDIPEVIAPVVETVGGVVGGVGGLVGGLFGGF